jgi:large subunit ribosomal protein L25
MKQIVLSTKIRQGSGKKSAHKIRAGGSIPGILYGHKEEPISLTVPEHELWQMLHHSSSEHLILKLKIEDSKEGDILTLVRDVQHHPVTGEILHIDFQRISMAEKIKVGVPVDLNGIARGVKEFGGILDHGVREVNVKCTPGEIPEALHIDVSEMEIGNSVHLRDIMMHYPNLEFLDDPSVTLAHVSPPKKLEITAEEEAAAAAAEAAEGGVEEEEEAEGQQAEE